MVINKDRDIYDARRPSVLYGSVAVLASAELALSVQWALEETSKRHFTANLSV